MSRSPSANIVDNSLVLSLPNALNPVVWRMELKKTQMSAIEIREDKIGDFTLILKTPKGDSSEIARFGAKNDALKGLNAITGAMNKAERQEDKSRKTSGKASSVFKRIFIGLGAIIAFMIVFFILANILALVTGAGTGATPNAGTSYSSTTGALQDGVPQSADDFLKAQ